MATIVNDRDLILQGVSPRFVTVPTASLTISVDTPVFHVSTDGTGTPTTINLTANLVGIAGTVTWSVISGASGVTPSGNTCTLAFANMTAASATVQATITYLGVTYTTMQIITKVTDGATGSAGADGTNGSNGARGTVNLAISGYSEWSASVAASAIISATGSNPMINDVVTEYDSTHSFTYFCTVAGNPGTWVIATQYLNGNLFVTGTIGTSAINATTGNIGAVSFSAGTTTFSGDINTSGQIVATGASTTGGYTAAIGGNGDSGNRIGVYGKTTTSVGVMGNASGSAGIGVYGNATGAAAGAGYGVKGYSSYSHGVYGQSADASSSGVYGYNSVGGEAGHFSGKGYFSGQTDIASTLRATGLSAPTSGTGVEVAYDVSGDAGYIVSYRRTATEAYKPLKIDASLVSFRSALDMNGAAASAPAGHFQIGNATQTTVGANGAASALTALPLGYIVGYLGTTKIAIPYYNG